MGLFSMIENYAQQLFLYSPQAVIVMDVESKILEVNTAFKQVSGYCLEEVVGQSLHLLSAAKLADDFYETIWLELMNHGSWQGEVWNRHKDGAVYPAWFNVIKISDDSGNHSGYIAQFFNSSYLKSAESTNQQVAQRIL